MRKEKIIPNRAGRDRIINKRQKEQRVVSEMITLYCRKKHKNNRTGELCGECLELLNYAKMRGEHCPFMEEKTFCSNCKVHCYKPQMREKIRAVMRFAGPRMIMYHPGLVIWHLACSLEEKKKERKS